MSEPKRNAPRPHGPGRGMMPTEKAKDFKGSFKKLISYLSPFKFKILIVVIFAALSTVFTIVGPKILAKATDELTAGLMRIITGAAEGIDFAMTALFVVIMVEQWMEKQYRPSVVIGLVCGLVCRLVFGADNFILPTMICVMVILLSCKKIFDKMIPEDGKEGGEPECQ